MRRDVQFIRGQDALCRLTVDRIVGAEHPAEDARAVVWVLGWWKPGVVFIADLVSADVGDFSEVAVDVLAVFVRNNRVLCVAIDVRYAFGSADDLIGDYGESERVGRRDNLVDRPSAERVSRPSEVGVLDARDRATEVAA